MLKVAVIGFGRIGSVIGAVLAAEGLRVLAVDQNQRVLEAVERGDSPFGETGLETMIREGRASGQLTIGRDADVVAQCGVVIIAVGTPLTDSFDSDLSQLESVVQSIQPYLQPDTLVILKSTVSPGTTDNVVHRELAAQGAHVAFCPERVAEGRAIEELRTIPIVIGGTTSEATRRAGDFWETALGVETIRLGSARAAEMVKLANNLWIDLNIALAQELALIAEKLEIDVLDVIRAANSLPKGSGMVNILLPSVGVGGYCLTKDPWFVHSLGEHHGLDLRLPSVSRGINDKMPHHAARLIQSHLEALGEPPAAIKVAILGITFKNDTSDCRFTPTRPVIEALQAAGYQLAICDPWTSAEEAATVTDLPVSADITATIAGAHCVAFLAGHRQFRALDLRQVAELLQPGALVFDGRMFFTREQIEAMIRLGLNYKGVGR